MMLRATLIVLLGSVLSFRAPAQMWEIFNNDYIGLRVSGPGKDGLPVIVGGQQVQFTLDAIHRTARDLRVNLVHCDRNWRRTASEFINDPYLLKGQKPLSYRRTAAGVRRYEWTYAGSFPSGAGIETPAHSGNYIAEFVDAGTEEVVARIRFLVAERESHGDMTVRRRRLPMAVSPWNEAHEVSVVVDERSFDDGPDRPYLQLIRVVDIYRNREWGSPYRIDLDNLTDETWVEGLGTPKLVFTAGAVMPGNEYRVLDIRNVEQYPAGTLLRPRDGADVTRFLASPPPDNNGSSVIVSERGYADYEQFEFQLWWESDKDPGDVFVLGDFNAWTASDPWKLERGDGGRYSLRGLLKRGRYDYAYVVGGDRIVFEGNSWNTSNVYTAVVYYSDPRLGGFDRILFVEQAVTASDERGDRGNMR